MAVGSFFGGEFSFRTGDALKYRFICLVLCLWVLLPMFCACRSPEVSGESAAGSPAGEELKIVFPSVGKADVALIRFAEKAILVDTGTKDSYETIAALLQRENVQRIDLLLLTHFDEDHIGSASKILENYTVERILQPDRAKDSGEYRKYSTSLAKLGLTAEKVTENRSLTLGDVQLEIFPATKVYEKSDSNNSSLVLRFSYGEKVFLFAGDIEKDRIEDMEEEGGLEGPVDFFKVPHHGEASKQLIRLIQRLSPAVSVITSSEEEPEASQVLLVLGEGCYLTRNGEVTLVCDGRQLNVSQSKG